MGTDNGWLHRSNDWGGKPHVDIYNRDSSGNVTGQSHGHSPTLNPPSGIESNGTINIGSKKDLPPPYGPIK
ncbi:MAG: hypothetical protein HQL36_04555 [Alphaproteobacteria bacterium]|nr:hypothetical protein [Alphaproteobacteria bacterium]